MTAVVPMMLIGFVVQNPNHPLVRVLTFFPYTAPITAMERIGAAYVPWWELALSLAILAGFVVIAMILAAKIFRMGILMYGKRPSLVEIVRYIREA